MKRSSLSFALFFTLLAVRAHAQLLTESFTYTSGSALVGQGGWTQIATTSTSPLTITSGGAVALGTSGQDAGVALSSSVNSGSLFAGFNLTVSAVQAAGDYFFAFNTGASASNYAGRLFAKSSGAGYVLGYQMGATGATPTYSSTVLSFSSTYRIVVGYNFVTGTLNDTGIFYVDPTSSTQGSNTSAISQIAWTGTSAENASLAAVSLRQGTAGSAATIAAFDNLSVATDFATASGVSAIPEPSTYAAIFGGLALVGAVVHRRRKATRA